MTLYENLAQRFISDIKAQKLPTGSRLPALRVICQQHKVSMTTATRAYDYLQQAGWIYAQPQSGYFVSPQADAYQQDHAPAAHVSLDKMEPRDPKDFAPLNGYNPTSALFTPLGTSMIAPQLQPAEALQRCIKRVTRRAGQQLFEYPDPQGEIALRSALAQHFQKEHFAFLPQDLVITNGCIDSVRIAIETLTQVGDTIAIGSPCFSGLLDLLVALSRNVIEIPLGSDGLDLEYFESVLQQGLVKASLFSTSNINPTGQTLSVKQKQTLAQLAARYQIPMIEDDIYFELSHQNLSPLPSKHWDNQGYVVWCGSVSKSLAAGMRLGWCLPGQYLESYRKKQVATGFGVNGLMQSALAEFINTGEYQSHVNKVRRLLGAQIHDYRQFLSLNLPQETKISLPQGGIVLWLQIPNLNTLELEQQANQAGIDMRSGACFSTHDVYHDCLRINCGWPLQNTVDKHSSYQQLQKLCELINTLV